ncbi:MAG TPA: protein phosphatase 2C domain-containing protein [Candidatus Limiplasma sp.]|nr:protein phosphatase 2C domain-containing protein [Candidatus Limiplasma sp.]
MFQRKLLSTVLVGSLCALLLTQTAFSRMALAQHGTLPPTAIETTISDTIAATPVPTATPTPTPTPEATLVTNLQMSFSQFLPLIHPVPSPTPMPTALPTPTPTPTATPTPTPTPEPVMITLTLPTPSVESGVQTYAAALSAGLNIEGKAEKGASLLLTVTSVSKIIISHSLICDGEGVFSDRITPEECARLENIGEVVLKVTYADFPDSYAATYPFIYQTARANDAQLIGVVSYSHRDNELTISGTISVPFIKLSLQCDTVTAPNPTISGKDGSFSFTLANAMKNGLPLENTFYLIFSDDTLRPEKLMVTNITQETLIAFTSSYSNRTVTSVSLVLLGVCTLFLMAKALLSKIGKKQTRKTCSSVSDSSIEAAACNDKGRVRGNNEDNFYLNGRWMGLETMDAGGTYTAENIARTQLYAVCDGMGGESAGEKASCQAVTELHELMQKYPNGISDTAFTQELNIISENIHKNASGQGLRSGTTFAGCLWQNGKMRIAHVGDSRVYRLRGGVLKQMTVDHSEVQRLLAMGVITPSQAKTHPKRHVITQYLGMPSTEIRIDPNLTTVDIRCGDRFVLCSDGLSDMVEETQLKRVLRGANCPKDAATELVKCAIQNGGRDNVTVVCLFFKGTNQSARQKVVEKVLFSFSAAAGAGGLMFLVELFYRIH